MNVVDQLTGAVTGAVLGAASNAGEGTVNATRQLFAERFRHHYNERSVKRAVLNLLQQVREDTAALREAPFGTAKQTMQLWHDSDLPLESPINIRRVDSVREHAAMAYNTVADPMDKITATGLLIYATYHYVALSAMDKERKTTTTITTPDWAGGKREAQKILKLYMESLPQLQHAAQEELRVSLRRLLSPFSDRDRRRQLLTYFGRLSAAVFALHPLSENASHPRFPELEEAVVSCAEKLPLELCISHFLADPLQRRILTGHRADVLCCVVFHRDGRALTGSRDQTLRVWDLDQGREIQRLRGHQGIVFCCAVLSNGTKALSGSSDATLKVWNLDDGTAVDTLRGHANSVLCCCLLEETDAIRALSGSRDGTLKLWDLTNLGDDASGKEIYTLRGHDSWISCCAVFANDTRALSGSGDRSLKIWDLETSHEIQSLRGHTCGVLSCGVVTTRGGGTTTALSKSFDHSIRVWDLESGQCRQTIHGQQRDQVLSCATFAPETMMVMSATSDLSTTHQLEVWDMEAGQDVRWNHNHVPDMVRCCASCRQRHNQMVVGLRNGQVQIWEIPTWKPRTTMLEKETNEATPSPPLLLEGLR